MNNVSHGCQNNPENVKSLPPRAVDFSEDPNKKRIAPDMAFSFRSGDFDLLNTLDGVKPGSDYSAQGRDYPQSPPSPPPRNKGRKERALPSSPPDADQATPKRRVNAEARLATTQILQQLEHLDMELREMEDAGRVLEEKIRSGKLDVLFNVGMCMCRGTQVHGK